MASEWVLALEQNQESEVTQGSSAATAEAVRNGADLRLFLIAQGYEETLVKTCRLNPAQTGIVQSSVSSFKPMSSAGAYGVRE